MEKDSGVSTVLSEVLMIALVLFLVPVVTISLINQLPEDRVPTVNIKMDVNYSSDKLLVTLYHKGGDYIKKSDISIIIRTNNNGIIHEYGPYHQNKLVFNQSGSQVFDLGDSVTNPVINTHLDAGTKIDVSLISKNSVIYPGVHFL